MLRPTLFVAAALATSPAAAQTLTDAATDAPVTDGADAAITDPEIDDETDDLDADAATSVGTATNVGTTTSVDAATCVDASVPADAAAGPVTLEARWHSVQALQGGTLLRAAPDGSSARRGTVSASGRLPLLEARTGPGCTGPWVRVAVDAWLCSDRGALREGAPTGLEFPVVPANATMPFRYATTTHANTRAWRRPDDVGRAGVVPARLDRNMTLAVRSTRMVDGHNFAETADGRWVALADLMWTTLPARRGTGREYQIDDAPGAIAFASNGARAWPDARSAVYGTAATPGTRELLRHQAVRVTEVRSVGGVRVLRTDRGWVQAAYLARPEVPEAPADVGERERWVDVDRARQVMVAFEGRRPVWAALVSTGRPGRATAAGTFRVRIKMADDDMTNVGDTTPPAPGAPPTERYFVARVPWVMYFHGGTAFHAAFWHDDFGRVRSHGCVNLSPDDARWLFRWAPPAMPPGWTTALPAPGDPGMRVRVR